MTRTDRVELPEAARLHGHPRRDFGEVDAEAAFTRSRTHVIRGAASGVAEQSLNLRLRMLADGTVVERDGTMSAFRLNHLRTLPYSSTLIVGPLMRGTPGSRVEEAQERS